MFDIDNFLKSLSDSEEKFQNLKSHNQEIDFKENNSFDPIKYEDTIFKDLANDLKNAQNETNHKIDKFTQDYKKSGILPLWISCLTLIVAILTLIATLFK